MISHPLCKYPHGIHFLALFLHSHAPVLKKEPAYVMSKANRYALKIYSYISSLKPLKDIVINDKLD